MMWSSITFRKFSLLIMTMGEHGDEISPLLNYLASKPDLTEITEKERELKEEFAEDDEMKSLYETNIKNIEVNEGGKYAVIDVRYNGTLSHSEILYKFDDSGQNFEALEPSEEELEDLEQKIDVSVGYDIEPETYSQDSINIDP